MAKDIGWSAPGVHQYQIIVGMKPNPAYNPNFNPLTDVLDLSKLPQEVPDVRILNLNGAEDANAVVAKLQVIKNSLPENRVMPEIDRTMTSINQNPEKMYEPAPVQPANLGVEMADADFARELSMLNNSPLVEGVPIAKETSDMESVLMETLNAVKSLAERIGTIEDSLESRKGTKPQKAK